MPPSFFEIFSAFIRLGCSAFGGPAMAPYIRAMAVKRKGWVSEESFRTGLSLAQVIPGATAMQIAAWVGLRTRGIPGALAAYLGFALPAYAMVLVLSFVYVHFGDAASIMDMFNGLKIIVVALVAHATMDFAKRYLKSRIDALMALAAAFWLGFNLNPIAAIAGIAFICTLLPDGGGAAFEITASQRLGVRETIRGWSKVAGVLLLLLALLWIFLPDYFDMCLLMVKVDLFAFGGGYVSIPLMLHEFVGVHGWMSEQVFMDGIALGQLTPGPIVITAAFVGYYLKGLAGSFFAALYVFAPSFLIVTGSAPFVDRLLQSRTTVRALRGSLISLVGLLASVTVRFAGAISWGWLEIVLVLAAFAALRKQVDILWVVLSGCFLSILLF